MDYVMSSSSQRSGERVVVLGGGPGGYPAAFLAADMGYDVTLVDINANPGGVCLYIGCIPSKALLHVAKLIHESREAAGWGVKFGEPEIDLEKLRGWKDKVVRKLTGGLGALSKQRKVKFIQGRGRFHSNDTLVVADDSGNEQAIRFDYAIIATGSRPARPKALALESEAVWDSTAALMLKEVPKNLLVLGGGYIGLEMGTVYSALGSEVSVVEMTSGLLPGADRDLVDVLSRKLKGEFKEVMLNTRVTEMKEVKGGVEVNFIGLDVKEPARVYEKVLVSVGRRPNSEDIGLENLQVKLDQRGFVQVDAQRKTGEANIYAIGDVAGEPGLAHKATHEARVAVESIAGIPGAFAPAAIPAIVFTDPEVAWCGLTETEALNKGIPFKVAKFPWAASGRAITLDRPEGFTKILVSPQNNRIIGVGIVGAGAGELIAEATLAVEMGATVEDLRMTIHPHPTLSETLMEAAEVYLGHSAHFMERKRSS